MMFLVIMIKDKDILKPIIAVFPKYVSDDEIYAELKRRKANKSTK